MLLGLDPNITAFPLDYKLKEVSACLVSPKAIDPQILATLSGLGEVIVGRGDSGVYGRYEAIAQAKYDIIYTQDDDCVVDVPALTQEWDGHFISNMKVFRAPEYPGNLTLIGWGAMFRKDLVDFSKYYARYRKDEFFLRECDRIFTGLTTHKTVFVDVENLPSAGAADRMSAQAKHWDYLTEAKNRLRSLGCVIQ